MPKPGEPGFAQDLLKQIRQFERHPRKPGMPRDQAVINDDYPSLRVRVTLEFPLEKTEDPLTLAQTFKVMDILEPAEAVEVNA